MRTKVQQQLFSPPQIAAMIGSTINTVMYLINTGQIEAFNYGLGKRPRWRISMAALDEFNAKKSNRQAVKNRDDVQFIKKIV